ncbi:MAG: hemolysin family protein [Candidatus Saccharimonadales bacterium]
MSLEMGLVISVVVLLANAFFVAAEFSLVSVRRSSVELKALAGSRVAKITISAMENVSMMLAGAQLGVTLSSLVFGAVGEPLVAHALEGPFRDLGLADHLLHPVSFVIALVIMVYLHVVIGEMIPKNISLSASMKSALILVPPLYFIVKVFTPVLIVLNALANFTIKLFGVKITDEVKSSFSRDEVAGFVKESLHEGLLSKEEERLLSGALDLEERTIDHIILSIESTVVTPIEPTPRDIEKLCAETGFSRFPVPDKNEKLIGYIHLKDLLRINDEKLDTKLPRRFIRPLDKVKKGSTLRDTLALMQLKGAHIAQVVNDDSKTVGIIMLEDVLEELVGPISDDTRQSTFVS